MFYTAMKFLFGKRMAPAQTIYTSIAEESVIEIENRLAALWKRFAVLRFCLPINPSTFSCGERGDAATRTRTRSKEITLQFFTPILLHYINICTIIEELITKSKN